jgi:hypothetical protein
MAKKKTGRRRVAGGRVPKGLSKTVAKRKAAAKKNPKGNTEPLTPLEAMNWSTDPAVSAIYHQLNWERATSRYLDWNLSEEKKRKAAERIMHDWKGSFEEPVATDRLTLKESKAATQLASDIVDWANYAVAYNDVSNPPWWTSDAMHPVENPRKKSKATKKKATKKKKKTLKSRTKKAGKKVRKGAKKAGKKIRKFAKTKEGYAAGGAGVGALVFGPLGAIAGAVGGSALHDNPGRRSNPTTERHRSLADQKWNQFEESYGSWTMSDDPEDLIAAYTAALEAELHYKYAGIEHDDTGRGYGPAGAEAGGIGAEMIERIG